MRIKDSDTCNYNQVTPLEKVSLNSAPDKNV